MISKNAYGMQFCPGTNTGTRQKIFQHSIHIAIFLTKRNIANLILGRGQLVLDLLSKVCYLKFYSIQAYFRHENGETF